MRGGSQYRDQRVEFEWDEEKQRENVRKHGVGFAEASTVFGDPLEVTISDPDHSIAEHRFLSVGLSAGRRVLVVSYVERANDRIRIISARAASHRERTGYESG